MRHGIAGNRLNRQPAHRKATLKHMAKAILIKQRILTTKAKAKEGRKLIEKIITLGKKNTLAAKRRVFAMLCDHSLVSQLFDKIAPRFKNRVGGYTRIIPLATPRRGDNASMVFLELTEKEEVVVAKPKVKSAVKSETVKTEDVSVEIEKKENKEKIVKDFEPKKQQIPQAQLKAKKFDGLSKMFKRKTSE